MTFTITKKEFKEMVSIHVYGRGERRRVRLYFDWKEGYGYLYMILGYGVTKAQILKDAYDMLIMQDWSELCWYDTHIGKIDFDRIKVQISG
jgi:hypothetical protein